MLARRPTLLVPPFKSSLTYDEPTDSYRSDLHGQLQFQVAHALQSGELMELHQWWTRLNAGRSSGEGTLEERLRKEERWRKAAEASFRQARMSAEADRAALEAAQSRIKALESYLLRQSETSAQLLSAFSRGCPQDELLACLQDMNGEANALLNAPGGDDGTSAVRLSSSRGFLLASETGPGNFNLTTFTTEDEARAMAQGTWSSYVLYDLAVPWQPREVGDGGLGFGHTAIRAHVEETHGGPSSCEREAGRRAVGAPEYEQDGWF